MNAQDRIKIKYETYLRQDENGRYVVTLHQTDIVTYDEDSITLNTGGWKTATTKARMNFVSEEYRLGYKVVSKNREWQVAYNGEAYPYPTDKVILDRNTGEVVTI
jgi:hypothetical protein